MKMLKKLLLISAVTIILICIAAFNASAETYSGTCGDNLTWNLDTETSVLEISGSGTMTNYSFFSTAPWMSYDSYIKTVKIGNEVTNIGNCAFYWCSSLSKIIIGDHITAIGDYAFTGCSFPNVTIPDSITVIGNGAFANCDNLTRIELSDNVTTVGEYAFAGCDNLVSIKLGDGVTVIGYYAFTECISLMEITIPNSVTLLCPQAFIRCHSLVHIEFSNKMDRIYSQTFGQCKNLKSIIIPSNITAIGTEVFFDCTSLEYVHIPNTVLEIGEGILEGTTAYICSDTEDCYAKEYAEANGYEFRLCEGHNHEHVHVYTAEITQTATATQNCVITYTCSCGDSYTTESVANGFDLFSTANVDFDNNFIFGLSVGIDSLEAYTTVVAEGFAWIYELTDNGFGTGTVAKLTDGETVLSEYTILIFGDTDGDAWYNGEDAFIVNLIVNGMLDKDDVGEAVWTAADCNHDGEINEADYELLMSAGLLLNDVDQSKPVAELITNEAYIEYMGLIDQSVEITTDTETNDTNLDDTVGNGLDRSENENDFEIFFADIIAFIKQIFSFIFSLIFN